jgi:hypothetical protein
VAQLQFHQNDKQPANLDIDLIEIAVPLEFALNFAEGDLLQFWKDYTNDNYTPSYWITNNKLGDNTPYSTVAGHAFKVIR